MNNKIFLVGILSFLVLAFFVFASRAYLQNTPSDSAKKTREALKLRNENDLQGAIKIMKEVLASEPKNVGAMAFLAEFYKAGGDTVTSMKYVDEGLALEPNNPLALRTKGDLLLQLGKDKEAEGTFNKVVSLSQPKSGDRIWANYGLSCVYLKQGLKDKAKESLKKAIEDNPTNAFFAKKLTELESGSAK